MNNLPNLLSLLRFPLALAFLQENPTWRCVAILLAMLSDGLDGYLARRFGQVSRIGTFLDPLADKFFVITALIVLVSEERLATWEALTMLCRDFSVILFGCYLVWRKTLSQYQFRSIWYGKLTTALQLAVLLALACQIAISPYIFISFIILGMLALAELYLERKKLKIEG